MGYASDEAECPQCGYGSALYEMETKSLQESLFCDRCGYLWMSRRNGAIGIRKTSEARGYGVLRLSYGDRPEVLDAFRAKLSQQGIKEIKRRFSDSSLNLSRSYLTIWDEQAKRVRLICGKLSKE